MATRRPLNHVTPAGLTGLAGVVPDRAFGQLTVRRTGLRTAPLKGKPSGEPAAECDCSCGATGVIVANHRLLSGNTSTCGHGQCTRPRGRNPGRDRILAYLAEHGPARLTEIAPALGMTTGAAGGQLYLMMAGGEIERPSRGRYCLPAQAAAS